MAGGPDDDNDIEEQDKRRRTGAGASAGPPLRRSDFTGLVDELKQACQDQMEQNARQYEGLLTRSLERWADKMDGRFGQLEAQTAALAARIDKTADDHDKMRAAISELQRQATEFPTLASSYGGRTTRPSGGSAASTDVPSTRPGPPTGDEHADPTIIKINTAEPIPRATADKYVNDWMGRARIPRTAWRLTGAGVDRFWVLRMQGQLRDATQRVEEALAALRDADGRWKEEYVDGPNNTQIRIHAGRDKTRPQMARERAAKDLFEALQNKMPGTSFYHVRARTTITASWRPLVRVVHNAAGEMEIQWNGAHANDLGITGELKNDIVSEYERRRAAAQEAAAAHRIVWSV